MGAVVLGPKVGLPIAASPKGGGVLVGRLVVGVMDGLPVALEGEPVGGAAVGGCVVGVMDGLPVALEGEPVGGPEVGA